MPIRQDNDVLKNVLNVPKNHLTNNILSGSNLLGCSYQAGWHGAGHVTYGKYDMINMINAYKLLIGRDHLEYLAI
jgi:hypothetical protein